MKIAKAWRGWGIAGRNGGIARSIHYKTPLIFRNRLETMRNLQGCERVIRIEVREIPARRASRGK